MVYGRPPFHAYKNTIQKMQAITNRESKIDFPATGPAGNVEKVRVCVCVCVCVDMHMHMHMHMHIYVNIYM